MPKMKTNKALAKRVRFTASGLAKVHHSGMGHLAPRKSRKQRKHLAMATYLSPSDQNRITDMMVIKKN